MNLQRFQSLNGKVTFKIFTLPYKRTYVGKNFISIVLALYMCTQVIEKEAFNYNNNTSF